MLRKLEQFLEVSGGEIGGAFGTATLFRGRGQGCSVAVAVGVGRACSLLAFLILLTNSSDLVGGLERPQFDGPGIAAVVLEELGVDVRITRK